MSSLTSGSSTAHSSASSSALFNAAVHQQLTRQAADEEHSLIDYSTSENRLYESPDGSLGISERPLGYVIGEQVVAPMIQLVDSVVRGTFQMIHSGIGYLRSCASSAHRFNIFPLAAAEESPKAPFSEPLIWQPEVKDLPHSLEACTRKIQTTRDSNTLKELYYIQGTLYKKRGMYQMAYEAFDKSVNIAALSVSNDFSHAHQLAQKQWIELGKFLKGSRDFSARQHFLQEIGFSVPSHYDYLVMSALVYELPLESTAALSNAFSSSHVSKHAIALEQGGWELAINICNNNLADTQQSTPLSKATTKDTSEATDQCSINSLSIEQDSCSFPWSTSTRIDSDLGEPELVAAQDENYAGMAFIHHKKQHIIIAHKGAKISNYDNTVDFFQVFRGNSPRYYEEAREFVEKVSARFPEYVISHAGYSLGAVYAELLAYHRDEFAITVESPGIRNMVNSPFLPGHSRKVNTVSYLCSPNFINTYNAHLGTLRTVDVTLSKSSWGVRIDAVKNSIDRLGLDWLGNWTKFGSGVVNIVTVLAKDFDSHQIHRLLDQLSPDSQQVPYQSVKKWPIGMEKRMLFLRLCGQECTLSDRAKLSYNDQHELDAIYQIEIATYNRIHLYEFSESAQEFLRNLRSYRTIASSWNPDILSLYMIEGDCVRTVCDEWLFTVQDFHAYIEHQMAINSRQTDTQFIPNPFYACCELEAPPQTEKSLRAEESIQIFFSLPSIQRLGELAHVVLNSLLEAGNKRDWLNYLKATLGVDFKRIITDELKTSSSHFKKRPKKFADLEFRIFDGDAYRQFLSVIHEPASFFIGKTFVVRAKNMPPYAHRIVDQSLQCRALHFKLEGGRSAIVNLDEHCTVNRLTYTEQIQREFHVFLINQDTPGAKFELELLSYNKMPDWIQSGKYIITEISRGDLLIVKIAEETSLRKYTITISQGKGTSVNTVSITEDHSSDKFDDFYQIQRFLRVKYMTEAFIPLSVETANSIITVSETFIDVYQEMREEVKTLEKRLIETLEKDETLLPALIEEALAEHCEPPIQLNLVPEGILEKVRPFIEKIQKLRVELGDDQPIQDRDLLRKAALEALYLRLLKSRFTEVDHESLSEALTLFTKSDLLTQKMQDKDLILLWGNTGAGKSTSIAGLIGCELEEVPGQAGQMIYAVAQTSSSDEASTGKQKKCPKIGHSLSSSETKYAEGFPITDEVDLMAVDMPGKRETRGDHYALCAALSVDQALRAARSIRSVVIVVPLASFLLDRGSGVIDLIDKFEQTLPKALDNHSDRIHLLVTKHVDYTDQELRTLLNELWKDETAENRKRVWNTLVQMHAKRHIKLAYPDSDEAWKERLDLYRSLLPRDKHYSPIDVKQFVLELEKPQTTEKFITHIESGAAVWMGNIFGHQLNLTDAIASKGQELAELEQQIQNNLANLNSTRMAIHALGEDLSANPAILAAARQTCTKAVEVYRKEVAAHQNQTDIISQQIIQLNKAIRILDRNIQTHSVGTGKRSFDGFKALPNEILYLGTPKAGALEVAHGKGVVLTNDDIAPGTEFHIPAKDYTGKVQHTTKLDPGYYLAPDTREQQEELERLGVVDTKEGQYKAEVSGEYYKINLYPRIAPDGRSIVYYVLTDWVAGRVFPHWNVSFETPKIRLYAGVLANWYSEKGIYEEKRSTFLDRLNYFNQAIEDNLDLIESKEKECKEQLKEQLLTSLQRQAEDYEQQDQKTRTSISQVLSQVSQLKKERKQVSLLIRTRWSTAQALHSFALLVSRLYKKTFKDNDSTEKSELVETSQKYQDFFREHELEILGICEEDFVSICNKTAENY